MDCRVTARCRYSTELVDCVVTMDRRKLDKLVGLKTDIDEILEGSHLYACSAAKI